MADLIAELARIGHVANRDTPSFRDRSDCLHFLRTHHAELEAAVRDAAYGRALREAMEAEYQAAKKSRKGGKQEPWITTYTLLRRLKVAADHLIDQAMRNSAREGL
jgi:hypothetical protein